MQHVALTAHLVRLDLLEAVRPELLIRFLRPFEDYLTSRGVALDGVACATEWIATLHAVLNAVDPEIPGELQQGLLDVADLTTESAHELARGRCRGTRPTSTVISRSAAAASRFMRRRARGPRTRADARRC